MYIRWKKRKAAHRPGYRYSGRYCDHYSAVVVETRRVEGKPRQFVVQHLASISDDMRVNEYPQVAFWRKALTKLDALEITGTERERMEATLLRLIPRPTPETMAEIEAELAARNSRTKAQKA